MGKGRRHKPKKNFAEKRREKQKNGDEWDKRPQRCYADIIRENKDFENYYKMQKIVTDDEWEKFMTTMRENLPVAFRITGSKAESRALLKIIKGDFFEEILDTKLENDQDHVANTLEKMKPQCLPFYPDGLAWQLQLTRKDIRRSEAYFRLHNFLIAETSSGSISRQEVVSMIPPLVLDVKPSHKVLDMCAAPGSKTAQLIEAIHSDDKDPHPEGFVIANDLDNNRCYMLVHQAKRLNSPNILITNHDSSVMPNFNITKPDGTKGLLKFDRILADVPCSGDGTMRKNPDIWCKWTPANGNNLHGIQFRIAKRGLELLEVGGKMVYSTCSLNPIENEAVLHRLLCETGDSVRIVDGRDLVPGLRCDSGVSSWILGSKDLNYYKTWEDVPEQWQTQIRPKMFPPKPEDAHKFNLEKSMRILPHHQDTGGFFVAVLAKVKNLPWESESAVIKPDPEEIKVEEGKEVLSLEAEVEKESVENKKRVLEEEKKPWGPQRKRKRVIGYREDPFVFFKDETEDVWASIKEFYDISDQLDPRCLLVRCHEGKKKNVYLTSPAIRDIVLSNEDRVKMINTGVKTFVRCDNKNMKCAFRLAQEGMRSIFTYVGEKRKVQICKEDLIMLLQNDDPHTPPEIEKLSKPTQERLKDFVRIRNKRPQKPPRTEFQVNHMSGKMYASKGYTKGIETANEHNIRNYVATKLDNEIALRYILMKTHIVHNIATGSCILLYTDQDSENPDPLKLDMVGWRGTMSLRAYVPTHDAIHYLRLLGADCSKFEKNKFQQNRDAIALKVETEEGDVLKDGATNVNGPELKVEKTESMETAPMIETA